MQTHCSRRKTCNGAEKKEECQEATKTIKWKITTDKKKRKLMSKFDKQNELHEKTRAEKSQRQKI